MLGMVSKGIAAFSQVLASHGYMVPAVLPSLVSLSQSMLAIAQFTFFTPRWAVAPPLKQSRCQAAADLAA
jgi:hypothetical protein